MSGPAKPRALAALAAAVALAAAPAPAAFANVDGAQSWEGDDSGAISLSYQVEADPSAVVGETATVPAGEAESAQGAPLPKTGDGAKGAALAGSATLGAASCAAFAWAKRREGDDRR